MARTKLSNVRSFITLLSEKGLTSSINISTNSLGEKSKIKLSGVSYFFENTSKNLEINVELVLVIISKAKAQ